MRFASDLYDVDSLLTIDPPATRMTSPGWPPRAGGRRTVDLSPFDSPPRHRRLRGQSSCTSGFAGPNGEHQSSNRLRGWGHRNRDDRPRHQGPGRVPGQSMDLLHPIRCQERKREPGQDLGLDSNGKARLEADSNRAVGPSEPGCATDSLLADPDLGHYRGGDRPSKIGLGGVVC